MARPRPTTRLTVLLGVTLAVLGSTVTAGRAGTAAFSDVGSGLWARKAIQFVAADKTWMRDYGSSRFEPSKLETRKYLARALVLAFAPNADVDPTIRFPDLAQTDPFYLYANVAAQRHWLNSIKGNFEPDRAVTMVTVHRALTLALGLGRVAKGINRIHTADGYRFKHQRSLGTTLVGMELGLRYNHNDESEDVSPSSRLSRAEVAWSLYRAYVADTTETWRKSQLAVYEDVQLPTLTEDKREVVEFGLRYVGYPYIYAGEWYRPTTGGYCCGTQPIGGFDCSGLMWWMVKSPEGSYDNTSVRPYEGWALPQRSSREMAVTDTRLAFDKLAPGDLMFYDGDNDGVIDHVNLFVGNGWALDSSSGIGGVTLLRVDDGWYRDHFRWGRRIIRT
jgi:cell wall-associated NlpC family hydrolase